MSSDNEWEPKRDDEYYVLPSTVTIERLPLIMAKGLLAYFDDVRRHGDDINIDQLIDVLDGWLEHDENHLDMGKFYHLVTDDNCEQFFDDVRIEIKNLSN